MLAQFAGFELDTERRELRRAGRLIAIEPKVFDFLVHVIANRDRVVSKDELIAVLWGGRIVSESAMTTCINAARTAIGDSGLAQNLIKTLPRKGIRFVGDLRMSDRPLSIDTAEVVASGPAMLPAIPDRPSVAVLPFLSLSADLEQEYFADGVVEDIITELSRIRWLLVIARNSSFTYKGRNIAVQQIGKELGVRYVLEGSVRKSANRIRFTAQLVDAIAGGNLWAERFDGTLDDVFGLQEQIARGVAAAIGPKLELEEMSRAQRKPTNSLNAYDAYLRGMASYYRWTEEANEEALRYFRQAITLDPEFAAAFGMAARCYTARAASGWAFDESDKTESRALSQRAVKLGTDDAVALASAGFVIARLFGELDAGARLMDRALALNPNMAMALQYFGWIKVWQGAPDAGLDFLRRALRLNPMAPQIFTAQTAIASAHFIAGRYGEAIDAAEQALGNDLSHVPALRVLVASLAMAGRLCEAKTLAVRLRALDPELRLANVKDRAPYQRREDLAKHIDGLRRAGIAD